MRFYKKIKKLTRHRIAILCFSSLSAIAAATPNYAMAAGGIAGTIASWTGTVIGGMLGSTIGWVIYVLNYIIITILGVAVAFIIWFIEVFLQLNTQIPTSLVVQEGFRITLSVANLGFVLGIIVIAIATILRYEQYGMKKILMKLVAAAILVNFSLVIAGVIMNFSDQLTSYFAGAVNPGSSAGNFFAFGDSLAGAFAPQRVFINVSITGDDPSFSLADASRKFEGSAGQEFGAIFTPLLNILFPSIMLIMVVITLFALLVMLLIRYVFLSILLILMPFAWLLWVFPNFQGQWNKWWQHFLRWTFFAPIVMFFLYLAILAGSAMSTKQANNPISAFQGMAYNSNTPLVGGISSFFGGFVNQVVGTMLQMAVMVGLVLGGLFAANSFGITFANTAMGWSKTIGKGVGGWAGRRGKQLGGAALDRTGMRGFAERLQQTGARGNAFTRLVTLPVRYAGRGIENVSVSTRENLVKDAEKRLSHLTPTQLSHGMSTFTAPERIAALKMLRESGDLERNPDLNRYNDEGTFRRFGQSSSYRDMDRALVSNDAMRRAAIDGTQLNENVVRAIIEGFRTVDISKGKNWDEMFGVLAPGTRYMGMDNQQKERLNIAQIRAMAQHNEKLISPIISQLRGVNLRNFQRMHEIAIQGLPNAAQLRTNLEQKIYYQTFSSGAAPTPPPGATPGGTPGAGGGGAAAGGGGGGTP